MPQLLKPLHPRGRAPTREQPPQRETRTPQPASSPCSLQLEKARAKRQRPSIAKDKQINKTKTQKKRKKEICLPSGQVQASSLQALLTWPWASPPLLAGPGCLSSSGLCTCGSPTRGTPLCPHISTPCVRSHYGGCCLPSPHPVPPSGPALTAQSGVSVSCSFSPDSGLLRHSLHGVVSPSLTQPKG